MKGMKKVKIQLRMILKCQFHQKYKRKETTPDLTAVKSVVFVLPKIVNFQHISKHIQGRNLTLVNNAA
jgi:hypothetical protein